MSCLLYVSIGQGIWGISGKHTSCRNAGHFVVYFSIQKSYPVPNETLIKTYTLYAQKLVLTSEKSVLNMFPILLQRQLNFDYFTVLLNLELWLAAFK